MGNLTYHMTLSTLNTLCSKSCGLSAHLLTLRAKLEAEAGRDPTDREAAEVAEQVQAVAAVVSKSGGTFGQVQNHDTLGPDILPNKWPSGFGRGGGGMGSI